MKMSPLLRIAISQCGLYVVLLLLVLAGTPSAQAANTSHTLTSTGANNLSAATWTGGAPTNTTIGDMAIYATAATASTTTIDVNTTLGGFRTNGTGVWTISAGAGTLTLDATGLTSANSPFSNAGVAFLANTSTAAGGLTFNSDISLANTNLDIGTTSTGSILVGGAITATTAQNLNFRANAAGVITDSANIGASGSNIAISNLGTGAGATTLSGILGTSVTTVTQNSSTSSLTLSGANTYTGATTIGTAGSSASGGTLTVSGASGTINASSGVTIVGSGSKLLLDNTAGNVDRVKNTGNVSLSLGAEFSLTGNATADTTETVAAVGLGAGNSIMTVTSATGRVTTLAADSLARTGNGTALVRATALDQSVATNVSRITLVTAPTGADFVGTNTLANGATNDATQALKIVPWLIGDTAVAGTGTTTGGFVTYDSTLGLRLLNATEYTTLAAGSTTAANPINAVAFNGTITTSGLTVNSLLFKTASQTLNGSGALTVNSGAVAAVTNTEVIGSGFSSLSLGNGEGIVTATSGNTLTINTPVNVTSSGGLTKSGAGTVVLGASNLYTGQTTVNQGTLQIGTGTAGDLGSNTSSIVLNGGNLSFGRTNAGLTIANNISGTGAVTQSGVGGTTVLSGANSYSGATTVGNGSTLQAVANVGNTISNVSTALSPNSGLTLSNGAGTTTLKLRADSDTTFTTGTASVNAGAVVSGNVLMAGGSGTSSYTFDVGAATTASNHILTLGNIVYDNSATSINSVNVTSGSTGYTLQVGSMSSSNRAGVASSFTFNPTTANLIVSSFSGSTATSSTLTFTGGGNTTFTGNMTAASTRPISLVMNQTGTVTFNGVNNFRQTLSPFGTTALNNGTLVLNNSSALNGASSGAATAVVNLGTTTATSNNVTVLLGGTNATGTVLGTNGGITIATSFVAQDTDTGTLIIGGQNTSNTNTYSGTITLGATSGAGKDVTLVSATGGTAAFTGAILINPTGTVTTGGITVGDASGNNNGTVRLTAQNTFPGATTLRSGTLDLSPTIGTTNVLSGGGNLTFTGGTLKYGNASAVSATNSLGDYSSRIKNSTGAISVDTTGAGSTVTYAGVLDATNTGGLTKLGTGTLNLNAAHLYSGTTTVSAGTLALGASGSIGSSALVKVAGGATFDVSAVSGYALGSTQTLRGAGNVTGAVALASGSTVAGGVDASTLGTLTFSSTLTSSSGGTFSLKLNSGGTPASDELVATGFVLGAGTATLSLSDLGSTVLTGGTTFTLLHSTSTSISGTFFGMNEGATFAVGANTYTISYLANSGLDVTLTATAIPEPSTCAALFGVLAFGGVLIARRRRA